MTGRIKMINVDRGFGFVKGEDGARIREAVRRTLATMEADGRAGKLRYDVDVDPASLLG